MFTPAVRLSSLFLCLGAPLCSAECNYDEICSATFDTPCLNVRLKKQDRDVFVDLRSQFCSRTDDVQCVPKAVENAGTVAGWICAGTAVASIFSAGIFAPVAAVSCTTSAGLGITKGIGCVVNGASGWDITFAFGGAALDMFGAGEATAAIEWVRNCQTIGQLLREAKAAKAAGQVFQGGKLMSNALKARNSARGVGAALNLAQRVGHCAVEVGYVSECFAEWSTLDQQGR